MRSEPPKFARWVAFFIVFRKEGAAVRKSQPLTLAREEIRNDCFVVLVGPYTRNDEC